VQQVTDVPIIIGGSGFSIFPAELMELTGAGYGITGEGEEALKALLSHLDGKDRVPSIPNVLRRGDGIARRPSKGTFADLRTVPYSEIDRKIDFTPYAGKGVYSVQTKRGCSHGCIYCTYPVIEGSSFRTRQPSDVADEIEQVYNRLGPVTVEFVDSTFNDPAGHAEAICKEIIRKKIRMRFRTMGINPRHICRELFELMKEAGFVQIDATPDTASPSVLKNMNKGFLLEDIVRTAEMIKAAGMPVMWFFLFGGPGENETTIRETFAFIDNHVHHEDMVFMSGGLRIYPGTPLYRIALREGLIHEGDYLLWPPPYYFSAHAPRKMLDGILREAVSTRPNCILGAESAPPPEMLAEAIEYRKFHGNAEPMFRTLLRIRKTWIAEGKI
jgi:radical SAM superfamily enzyme YgiQ (UPF0313 family)